MIVFETTLSNTFTICCAFSVLIPKCASSKNIISISGFASNNLIIRCLINFISLSSLSSTSLSSASASFSSSSSTSSPISSSSFANIFSAWLPAVHPSFCFDIIITQCLSLFLQTFFELTPSSYVTTSIPNLSNSIYLLKIALYSPNVSFGAGVINKIFTFLPGWSSSCFFTYSSIDPAIIYDFPERGIAPTNIFFSPCSINLFIFNINNS